MMSHSIFTSSGGVAALIASGRRCALACIECDHMINIQHLPFFTVLINTLQRKAEMMRLSLPPQTSMCSTRHTWIVLGFLLKAQRFLCSQIGTRETWNVMYSVVSSREEIQYLFSTQKAGAEEFSSLVTFVLSAWPGTAFNIISLSEICFSQSIYSTQLYGLYKEFWHSHV